jgi:beta-glucosidase/6-phospho-beta-glucosidase/beta-galactosidase
VRRGNNEWFKILMEKSVGNKEFPADFVGLQYYNEFEIGVLKQTLKDTAYAMNLKETEKLLPNGWKRHPEGALVQMLHISRWLMQTAMKIGTSKLPDLAITETGVPSNVNQNNGFGEYHVLANAISLGKDIIPNNVPFTWIWTLFDNLEWSSGFTPAFGIYKTDGSKKPEATIPPKPLNIGSAHVILELRKHIDTMSQYVNHLENLEGQQEEIRKIKAKIELTKQLEMSAIINLKEL